MDDDFKRDLRAAQAIRLPWWALLCLFFGAIIVGGIFNHFGRLEMTLPVLSIGLVIGSVSALKWKKRVYPWYWITLAIIIAIHALIIIFVPWTTKWVPAIVIAVIVSVDFYAMLMLFSFIEKRMAHEPIDRK